MTIGMYYQTEQEHQYDNLHVTSFNGSDHSHHILMVMAQPSYQCNGDNVGTSVGVCRQDLEVQQPWNVGLRYSLWIWVMVC